MVHVTLADLVVKHVFERLGLTDFCLGHVFIKQLSHSEPHSFLFVHLPELGLLVKSDLKSIIN
jgi:hypothetical protein